VTDKRCGYAVIIPLAIFATGVILAWATNLDIRIESWFFDKATGTWPGKNMLPFKLAYEYGELSGLIPGLIALATLIYSIWEKKYAKWRRACWFMILLLVVAPFLIVNALLKDNWGRPRPKQVEEFGGKFHYQPALVIGDKHDGLKKSFPSGHAAMGFCFMAPYFILISRNRRAATAWFWVGIATGLFIGFARMAQGAHWPSDVIWSFGIVYFSGYALARIMHPDRIGCDERQV